MVGRPVQLEVVKEKARPGETVLKVEHLTVPSHTQKRDAVHEVNFEARRAGYRASPASTATARASSSTA